ncbi:MAG: sugar transferase [Bryobacteraceae bacterium]|nr:sugar transferase [Bryobacteraceae bacterium]
MAAKTAILDTFDEAADWRARSLRFPAIATRGARTLKRVVDVVVVLVAFLLTLPLFVLVAVAILLESGHPVFFRQQRVGRGDSRFDLWKFRTMVVDGDELLEGYLAENPEAAREWRVSRKLRQDPRVTRVGRLLRRTSLDELPQLWNILRGEMSIAGPRPIVEQEIAQYGTVFPLYTMARPGLTGLWQVSGRNSISYPRRVELDRQYVQNWSPALDLWILWRTVGVVVQGTGAY